MYFLNGFLAGFLTGLFCFLIGAYPTTGAEITNEQTLARQNGWMTGLLVGLSISVTLIILIIRAFGL